jgi:tRNA pseudouridine13 synthase
MFWTKPIKSNSHSTAMMYKIKQMPEDFFVKENLKLEFRDNGRYAYYSLKKRECSTFDALQKIARAFHIKPKFINASGLKDKDAVTEQFISISMGPKKDLKLDRIELKYLGQGEDRLNIGTLEGNYFRIVVRNLSRGFEPKAQEHILNLFDAQRFGRDGDNHLVGKDIVKGDFKSAAHRLAEKDVGHAKEYLEENPTDAIGALRSIPKNILRFYVVSYQSHIWNECVKLLDDVDVDKKFPMPGFDLEADGVDRKVVDEILSKEGVTLRDFLIRPMPELTLESIDRPVLAKIEDLKITDEESDEENSGMMKRTVEFYLRKGAYATNVIRQMFGRE